MKKINLIAIFLPISCFTYYNAKTMDQSKEVALLRAAVESSEVLQKCEGDQAMIDSATVTNATAYPIELHGDYYKYEKILVEACQHCDKDCTHLIELVRDGVKKCYVPHLEKKLYTSIDRLSPGEIKQIKLSVKDVPKKIAIYLELTREPGGSSGVEFPIQIVSSGHYTVSYSGKNLSLKKEA